MSIKWKLSEETTMQKNNTQTYNRGSALSIFGTDRKEDIVALVLAFILAMIIYFSY